MILDVFTKDFERLAAIPFYSYSQYELALNSCGTFELRIALDDKALEIMQSGAYLLIEKEVMGIISYFNPSISEESDKAELVIKGRLVKDLLSRRCVPKTMNFTGTRTAIARSLVDSNCINPADPARKLPIVLSTKEEYNSSLDSEVITTQITGGSIREDMEELFDTVEMGYDLVPELTGTSVKDFEYRVIRGVDRTVHNTSGNDPVVFSRDLRNILSGSYTYNMVEYKNVAYTAGEGEGSKRTVVTSGSVEATGLDRYELYVDARDLQSKDSEESEMTTVEYSKALKNRGIEKLLENKGSEAYEASINIADDKFRFGIDYRIGDLVTLIDGRLGLTLDARVTKVTVTSLGEQDKFDVTFGYYKMTTAQKLKRKGVV